MKNPETNLKYVEYEVIEATEHHYSSTSVYSKTDVTGFSSIDSSTIDHIKHTIWVKDIESGVESKFPAVILVKAGHRLVVAYDQNTESICGVFNRNTEKIVRVEHELLREAVKDEVEIFKFVLFTATPFLGAIAGLVYLFNFVFYGPAKGKEFFHQFFLSRKSSFIIALCGLGMALPFPIAMKLTNDIGDTALVSGLCFAAVGALGFITFGREMKDNKRAVFEYFDNNDSQFRSYMMSLDS